MKVSKKQYSFGLCSIFIIVLAIVMSILDAVIPLNIWVHPVLTFLLFLFGGFSILCFAISVINKSRVYVFFGAILLSLSVLYVLICVGLAWYLSILVSLCICGVSAIFSFISFGSGTEEIALNREGSNYKNYEERKKEREALENVEEKPEIPEIKSFKD